MKEQGPGLLTAHHVVDPGLGQPLSSNARGCSTDPNACTRPLYSVRHNVWKVMHALMFRQRLHSSRTKM